jgi:hypothetical protein
MSEYHSHRISVTEDGPCLAPLQQLPLLQHGALEPAAASAAAGGICYCHLAMLVVHTPLPSMPH